MSAGWEKKRLGAVCSLINRGIAPKYIEHGGIAVLNQKCVRNHEISFELSRRHDCDAKKVDRERLVRLGDVLVNSTGTGTLGRVAQVRSAPEEPTTVDTHVTIVRPEPGVFYPDFFGYMLIQIEDEIAESGEGASGQTELARSTLQNKFTVSFPTSIAEQQRIAAILDETFSGLGIAAANAQKNLRNAGELFNSYLTLAFAGRKPGWTEKTIAEVADHCLGKMLDRNKNRGELQPYLRNLNVRWFEFDLSDVLDMRFESHETDRYSALKGDLLICEGGYPGRAAIWDRDEPIFFQKAIHRVRFQAPQLAKWFLYFLYNKDVTGDLHRHFTGAGIQHFTGQALARFRFPVPTTEEAVKLVAQFDQLAERVRNLEVIYARKLDEVVDLRRSILQRAFSGGLTSPPSQALREAAE